MINRFFQLLSLIIILFSSLHGKETDVKNIIQMTKQQVFELNIDNIKSSIIPYIKDKPYIQQIVIKDTLTQEIIFGLEQKNTKINIDNDLAFICPNNTTQFISNIVYEGDTIGEISLCTITQTNNFSQLNLTQKEKKWLKDHPTIRVHNEKNWAPMNFNKHGIPAGFSIDFMNLLAQKVGLNIEYITGEWNDLYNQALNKKLDVMLNIAKNVDREKYFLFTTPYQSNVTAIYGKKDDSSISSIQSLYGRKVAIVDGFYHENYIKEEFPLVQVIIKKNVKESLQSVCSGETDATIGAFIVNNHLINEIVCNNVEFKNELQTQDTLDLHIGIRNDYPELHSILQKAIASVGSNELNNMRRKWISLDTNTQKISLTENEREWIQKHPVIDIGGEMDWAPFDFVDESGQYNGLTKDYLDLISSLTGLEFKVHTGETWGQLLNSFKQGKYAMLPAIYFSKEREYFMNFSNPYLKISDYYITKNGYEQIDDIKQLFGKKVAAIKGYEITSWLKKNYPQIKLIEYDTLLETLRAVESGTAVATIQDNPSSTYIMEKNFITSLKINNLLKNRKPVSLHMGIQKEYPILLTIINKALKNITREEKKKISNRWMSEIDTKSTILNLSLEEIEWLSTKPVIKFAVDPNWLPIEAINKDSHTYEGMMADYLEKIKLLSGIEFELVPTQKWTDSVELAKAGKIDMLAAASMTPERQEFLNFTNTTLKLTDGVIMRSDGSFISDLTDLNGKKVGVSDGTSLHNLLKTNYPKIIIVPIKGTQNGINALAKGDIDAFVGNLEVVSYIIFSKNLLNLKVVLKLDTSRQLHIALKKEYSNFALSIINKSIQAISNEEINLIRQKWVGLKVHDETDYMLLLKISIVIVIVFLLLAYYNRKLKKMVEHKTKDIQEQKQELETLVGQFDKNVIFSKTDLKGNITHVSEAFCKISGYSYEELIGKPHSIVRHPETPKEIFKLLWETIQKEACITLEIKNKKKNGEFYWVQSRYEPDYDKDQNHIGYTALIVDITDKKAVESLSKSLENKVIERTQELENERRYINSIMNSQENIVVSTDGKNIRTANKAFFKFFKIKSLDEFINHYGNCICDTFDSCDTQEFIQKTNKGIQWAEYILQRPESFHKVKITFEGTTHIFAISVDTFKHNDVLLKVAVFSDITELENIRNNIESILTSISLPLLITSKKDRKILYANKYAEQQYEKPIEQIIGSSINTIYSNEEQQAKLIKELQENGKIEKQEEIFITHTGKKFIALLTVTPILYENEEAYMGMIVDITKQKQIEEEIRQIHKHTKDSIEYASLIQHSLIPNNELFKRYFSDYLSIWHPKDIIGGDIYLFDELRDDNECLLMVIDCTGHGVPGAFVTMLVKAIERQITAKIAHNNEIVSPAKILSIFNRSMKHLLKQEDETSISNAGFDGGILYYNKKDNIIKYAGAETPLFYIDENREFQTIKGSRHSVGYKKSDANYEFKEHSIKVKEGMQFYLTTDGYLDQNGGEKGFPFGKKRFKALIQEYKDETFADQQEVLLDTLAEYQQKEERNDDVTIVGIKI